MYGRMAREHDLAVVLGEWGGKGVGKDLAWLQAFADYLIANDLSHFFWCLNPDSADTGGLLEQWASTPKPNLWKLELLEPFKATPVPTGATRQYDQALKFHMVPPSPRPPTSPPPPPLVLSPPLPPVSSSPPPPPPPLPELASLQPSISQVGLDARHHDDHSSLTSLDTPSISSSSAVDMGTAAGQTHSRLAFKLALILIVVAGVLRSQRPRALVGAAWRRLLGMAPRAAAAVEEFGFMSTSVYEVTRDLPQRGHSWRKQDDTSNHDTSNHRRPPVSARDDEPTSAAATSTASMRAASSSTSSWPSSTATGKPKLNAINAGAVGANADRKKRAARKKGGFSRLATDQAWDPDDEPARV